MANTRYLGISSQCKITDIMCLGDPNVSSDIIFYISIPGKVLLLCDFVQIWPSLSFFTFASRCRAV